MPKFTLVILYQLVFKGTVFANFDVFAVAVMNDLPLLYDFPLNYKFQVMCCLFDVPKAN